LTGGAAIQRKLDVAVSKRVARPRRGGSGDRAVNKCPGSTRRQDRRFHAVVDQFARPTRRRVQRAVAKGEPPLDKDLRPLALLYLERLERSAAHTRTARPFKMKLRTLYSLSAIIYTAGATFEWFTGGPIYATLLTLAAIWNLLVALTSSKLQANRDDRLLRSRILLIGSAKV
jgi:hypothetical protein